CHVDAVGTRLVARLFCDVLDLVRHLILWFINSFAFLGFGFRKGFFVPEDFNDLGKRERPP
ncbi:MAG: hypothetical protein J6T54_08785, partial [Fibrobacter sp.]|nr:hypothetical protein [Fibrobacter sp.]